MLFVPIVQCAAFRNFTRRPAESDTFLIVSIFGLRNGATFASDPRQMLFGSTNKIATIPAHVALPGLMGNRISAPCPFC
jgi:hypothetical protein